METAKQSLKEYVKEHYGQDLSEEEAAKFLEELCAKGAISEEELERVAAGRQGLEGVWTKRQEIIVPAKEKEGK